MFCREHKIWTETQAANLDEITEYGQLKVIQDIFYCFILTEIVKLKAFCGSKHYEVNWTFLNSWFYCRVNAKEMAGISCEAEKARHSCTVPKVCLSVKMESKASGFGGFLFLFLHFLIPNNLLQQN